MILGSLDPFAEAKPDSNTLCGRMVAISGFLRALLAHEAIEEVHLYLGDAQQLAGFRTQKGDLLSSPGGRKLRLRHRHTLREGLAATDYAAFHLSDWVTWFAELSFLRNRHARAALPITSTTHSLSYRRLMDAVMKLSLGGLGPSDAIVATSRAAVRMMESAIARVERRLSLPGWGGRIERIPLGVDVEALAPRPGERAAARARLGFADGEVVLLGFGRFCPYSKMDLWPLLGAFAQLRDAGRVRLVLAGARQGTRYAEAVAQRAARLKLADRVKVIEGPSEAEKADLYRAADVFVSAPDNPQETFGLTVAEALAAGLPSVVSDYDGYRDLVDDGVEGFRVPTWRLDDAGEWTELAPVSFERAHHIGLAQSTIVDVDALAARLGELARDADLRRAMGERALARARRDFDWRRVVDAHVALWRRLADQGAGWRGPTADPLEMDYDADFGHYVTARLPGETVLRATGRDLSHLRVYDDVQPLVSGDALVAALARAQAGASVDDLAAAAAAAGAAAMDDRRARLHVALLLKHGLLARG